MIKNYLLILVVFRQYTTRCVESNNGRVKWLWFLQMKKDYNAIGKLDRKKRSKISAKQIE